VVPVTFARTRRWRRSRACCFVFTATFAYARFPTLRMTTSPA
jgi:hypothetical protein